MSISSWWINLTTLCLTDSKDKPGKTSNIFYVRGSNISEHAFDVNTFPKNQANLVCWEGRARRRRAADSPTIDRAHCAVRGATRDAGGRITLIRETKQGQYCRDGGLITARIKTPTTSWHLPSFVIYLGWRCPGTCAWLGFVLRFHTTCPPPFVCFS